MESFGLQRSGAIPRIHLSVGRRLRVMPAGGQCRDGVSIAEKADVADRAASSQGLYSMTITGLAWELVLCVCFFPREDAGRVRECLG